MIIPYSPIWSGVRVSESFQKFPCLVDRLQSGLQLSAIFPIFSRGDNLRREYVQGGYLMKLNRLNNKHHSSDWRPKTTARRAAEK